MLTAQIHHNHFFRDVRVKQFGQMTRTRPEVQYGAELSLNVLLHSMSTISTLQQLIQKTD